MSTYKKNLYRFPLSLSAQLIEEKEQIDILVDLENRCFPEQMQAQRDDLNSLIEDEYATGLILYHDAQPIGYISGSHISELNSEDILAEDPFIRESQDLIFYVDSVAILGEERSAIAFDFLVHEMFALLKSSGYRYLAAHLRKRNGLSRLMKNRFSARAIKSYENWNECDEPFDYVLIDLSLSPTLPAAADYFVSFLRFIRQKTKGISFP